MKSRVRRSLIIGGIGIGALALGYSLGSFTTAGVNRFGKSDDAMAQLQAFARQREADQAARMARTARIDPAPIRDSGGAHVCEGCDAGASRYAVTNTADAVYDDVEPVEDDNIR